MRYKRRVANQMNHPRVLGIAVVPLHKAIAQRRLGLDGIIRVVGPAPPSYDFAMRRAVGYGLKIPLWEGSIPMDCRARVYAIPIQEVAFR